MSAATATRSGQATTCPKPRLVYLVIAGQVVCKEESSLIRTADGRIIAAK